MILSSPLDCCRPCEEPLVTNIPGAPGATGAAGADGTNGVDAYTTTTNPFTMPAELGSVTVDVLSSLWMAIGQILFLGDPGAAAKGWFQVTAKPSNASVTLKNLADTASSAYLDNSAPGTVFPVFTGVSPGGEQGPAGANGTSGAPVDATYITQTPNGTLTNEQALSFLATGLMKVTTATGVVSSVPLGIAASNVAPVDPATAPLVAGQVVLATAAGLKSDTAANVRTALGLVIGVADTNIPPVNDAAGLTNGEFLRATASGIESVTNAVVKSQLGIGYLSVITKSVDYTATLTDDVILVDATAAARTIGLPAVATATGKTLTVKKIDTSIHSVTIDGNLAELIDGQPVQVISAAWTAIEMVCNGSAWYII